MTLDECKKCKYHEVFQYGYVICTCLKFRDQRVIKNESDGTIVLVECPLEKK